MQHRRLMERRSEAILDSVTSQGQSQRRENAMRNAVQDMPLTEVAGNRVLTLKNILQYESYIAAVEPDGKPAPRQHAELAAEMGPLRDGVQAALNHCIWYVTSGFDTKVVEKRLHDELQAFADGLLGFERRQPSASSAGFKINDQAAYVIAQQISSYTADVMQTLRAVNAKFAVPAASAAR